jgi:hypothetical protein
LTAVDEEARRPSKQAAAVAGWWGLQQACSYSCHAPRSMHRQGWDGHCKLHGASVGDCCARGVGRRILTRAERRKVLSIVPPPTVTLVSVPYEKR